MPRAPCSTSLRRINDSTLDRREVGGRVATGEFKEADPDNDATLTKDEYLALVEKLFNEADADKDGTLSAEGTPFKGWPLAVAFDPLNPCRTGVNSAVGAGKPQIIRATAFPAQQFSPHIV